MAVEAELADGTVLEFPDGTSPEVVQSTVKKMMSRQQTPVSPAAISPATVVPTPVAAPTAVQPRATNFQQQRVSTQPTVAEELTGAVAEPLMKMGSAMIAKPVSEVMGIAAMFSDYLGNKQGDPMGFKRQVQESLTYEPRTNLGASKYNPLNAIPELMGQAASKVTTPVMSAIRGDAAPDTARGMAANFIGEAVPQAINIAGVRSAPKIGQAVTKAGAATGEAIANRGTRIAEAASDADWNNAARIEAAQLAQKYKIKVIPSETNPSAGNRLMDTMAGNKLSTKIVEENSPKWANIYKESVGLGLKDQLDAATFDKIRQNFSAPYGTVSKMNFVDDGTIATKIRNIEVPDVAANAGAAPKMTAVVDNIVNKLETGLTGKQLLAEIKALQDSARALMDAAKINPNSVFTAEAKAKRVIADQLYDMVLTNGQVVGKPELLKALKDAKVKIAQAHVAQDATNLVTYRLDPKILGASMAKGDVKLTGVLADMGKIAENFPTVADVSPTKRSLAGTAFSRAGAGGTAGAILGSMVGMPVEGGAIGASLGLLGGAGARKRVLSDKYQARNAVPPDRRMFPAAPLNPAQAPYQPAAGSTQVAPYDYSQQTYPSGYTPNFAAPRPAPAELRGLTFDAQSGKVVGPDVSNTVRVPNDKAMSEYLRAQEASRIADAKEAALAELGSRNAKAAAAREAAIAREKLMDAVEQLQEKLGNPRPTNLGGQGPKTRAFKRGLLTGENQ